MFLGTAKSLLYTKQLKRLYDSSKWEHPNRGKVTGKNWKEKRNKQFRGTGRDSIRFMELVEK